MANAPKETLTAQTLGQLCALTQFNSSKADVWAERGPKHHDVNVYISASCHAAEPHHHAVKKTGEGITSGFTTNSCT